MMPTHGYLKTSICLNFQSRIFQPPQEHFQAMVWFFVIFKFSYGWRLFHTKIVSKSVIQTSCYCVQQLFTTYVQEKIAATI